MQSAEASEVLYSSDIATGKVAIPQGVYHVLGRTDLRPVTIKCRDGTSRVVTPPNKTIDIQFSEVRRENVFWRCDHYAKRMHRYLTYSLRHPVPLFCVFMGNDFRFNIYFHSEPSAYFPPEVMICNEAKEQEWLNYLLEKYELTERLLTRLVEGTTEDRAIFSAADSFYLDNIELAYLSAWRTIDIIAEEELALQAQAYSNGMRSNYADYFSSIMPKLLSGRTVKINKFVRAKVALSSAIGFSDEAKLHKWHELRNHVVHSSLSSEQFREMLNELPELRNASIALLSAKLGLP